MTDTTAPTSRSGQTRRGPGHQSVRRAATRHWSIHRLSLDDPRVAPLVEGLTVEYDTRYGSLFGGAGEEMRRYPAKEFAAPHGTLMIVQERGDSIAGGAYRRYAEDTAELKRVWTHHEHRRRGLARFVLAHLEAEAARNGYRKLYLTTGPRQPEAKHLYLATGYQPQFDLNADPETIKHLAFTKDLAASPASVSHAPKVP